MGLFTAASSVAYLQYINSQIGEIDLDPVQTKKYYFEVLKMSQSEASRMYYWLYFDIGLMRVFTYHNYSTYCDKINKKIIDTTLKNYQDAQILTDIIKSVNETKQGQSPNRKLFNQVLEIRRKNFENIEIYDYIVKEMRKQQKIMDTRKILGFSPEKQSKIDAIHSFICANGTKLKND